MKNKLVLNERLLLTEAIPAANWDTPIGSAIATLTGSDFDSAAISKLKSDLATAATGDATIQTAADAVKADLDALKKLANEAFDDTYDLSILTAKVKDYVNKLAPFVTDPKIVPYAKGLNKLLQAVKNRLNWPLPATGSKKEEKGAADLKSAFDKLTTAAEAVMTKAETAGSNLNISNLNDIIANLETSIDDTVTQLTTLKGYTDDAAKTAKLQNIVINFNNIELPKYPGLSQYPEDDGGITKLLTLATRANIENGKVEGYLSGLNALLTSFLTNVNNEIAAETELKNTEAEIASNAEKQPWAELFKQAGNNTKEHAALWEKYYTVEWGPLANKVRDLGEAFTRELLNLGFSANVNPFIYFIKNYMTVLGLNGNNYPAIHNAYVKGYIDKNALKHNKMEDLEADTNILFCKDLYTKEASTILKYLELQSTIVNKYDNNEASIKNDALKEVYSKNCNLTVAVILTAQSNITRRPDEAVINLKSLDQKLRKLEDSYAEYKVLFGEDAKVQKINLDIPAIWNALGKKPAEAINAIKYLVANYNSSALKLDALAQQYKEIRDSSMKFDIMLSAKYKNIFDKYNITLANVSSLIEGLATAAKLTKI